MFFQIYWIVVISSILIAFALVINDIGKGRYRITSQSILSKEAEDKYQNEFPEQSINNLKSEIEKVADILVNTEESNRYTEKLRQKAQKDERIKALQNAALQNVELMKYVDGDLKARVKYKDYDYEYTLILSMNTVTTGRVFLNKYFIFKNVKKATETI